MAATINTNQQFHIALDDPEKIAITLVGVGGTGSALAIDLARLVYHLREKGKQVYLRLVDPDVVEAKNVGRQQFAPYEISMNKAVSMAARLNLWLGLDVIAIPDKMKHDLPLMVNGWSNRHARHIVVGAVDNHLARTEIANHLKFHDDRDVWWVDAGNGEFTGQVLVGNRRAGQEIEINEAFGLIDGLPAPHLQMPDLLEPEKPETVNLDGVDCALLTMRDEQSLNVNRLMAVYAAQYVYDIVVRRQVTTMGCYVSISPPAVSPVAIGKEALVCTVKNVSESDVVEA